MAKVGELKEQAREFERQGDVEKALALYRHILTHLEPTPLIARELPLYVKVGDLLVKQGEPDEAIAMYERAAAHYVKHGSGKSVIALCLKVLRVDPQRVEVYTRHARELLEEGHPGAAREVLADYATRAKQEKASEALAAVEGGGEDEIRRVVEGMLGVSGAGPEPAAPTPKPEPEPEPETEQPAPSGASDLQFLTAEEEMSAEPEPAPTAPAPSEPQASSSDLAFLSTEEEATDEPAPVVEEAQPAPVRSAASESLGSSGPLFSGSRPKKSHSGLIAAAAAVVVLAGGGFLAVRQGWIPLGSHREASTMMPDTTSAESTATAPIAAAESTGASSDTTAAAQADSGVAAQNAPTQPAATASNPAESTANGVTAPVPLGNTVRAAAGTTATLAAPTIVSRRPAAAVADTGVAAADSTARAAAPPPTTAPAAAAAPAPTSGTPPQADVSLPAGATVSRAIVVAGLTVDSVTGTTDSYHVVQEMTSGDLLTLSASRLTGADTVGTTTPNVTPIPGDSSVGTLRFWGYVVTARAHADATTLQGLLARLAIARLGS